MLQAPPTPHSVTDTAALLLFTGGQLVGEAGRPVWLYKDHAGHVQGPFSAAAMLQWHSAQRLPAGLLVCGLGPSSAAVPPSAVPPSLFQPLGSILASTAAGIRYNPPVLSSAPAPHTAAQLLAVGASGSSGMLLAQQQRNSIGGPMQQHVLLQQAGQQAQQQTQVHAQQLQLLQQQQQQLQQQQQQQTPRVLGVTQSASSAVPQLLQAQLQVQPRPVQQQQQQPQLAGSVPQVLATPSPSVSVADMRLGQLAVERQLQLVHPSSRRGQFGMCNDTTQAQQYPGAEAVQQRLHLVTGAAAAPAAAGDSPLATRSAAASISSTPRMQSQVQHCAASVGNLHALEQAASAAPVVTHRRLSAPGEALLRSPVPAAAGSAPLGDPPSSSNSGSGVMMVPEIASSLLGMAEGSVALLQPSVAAATTAAATGGAARAL